MTVCDDAFDRVQGGDRGGRITNQRDYDSTYIERYMGLPKDNTTGTTTRP